jgi:hypothetical protein
MFNRQRTLEVLGYDVDPDKRRRTKEEIESQPPVDKKGNLQVIDNCPRCGKERAIKLRQSKKNKPCSKCFHNQDYVLEAKRNQTKLVSEETKQKMRDSHWSKRGVQSAFKGRKHTDESREKLSQAMRDHIAGLSEEEKLRRSIKASCTYRGLEVEDFDGWATEEHTRLRGSKEYKAWEKAVIERDQHCQFPGCLEKRKSNITVHHKDGFHWCEDRRLDVSNGIVLCHYHHNRGPHAYHTQCGVRDATESKFDEWIEQYKMPTIGKTVYVVTGAPGSGKSWVCSQLTEDFFYISYDKFPKESHMLMMSEYKGNNPILYDPWRKATTFCKRFASSLDIKLVVITETEAVVKERIECRGGTFDDKSKRYVKRAFNIADSAVFSGTSQEVLNYLKTVVR